MGLDVMGEREMSERRMTIWTELRKRSNILRKSMTFANQVPRAYARLAAIEAEYQSRPPLLCNSFPKSGTHLLLQILEAFPHARSFGSFIASMPSFTFRERSQGAHLQRISWMVPGEVVGAHIFYDPAYAEELTKRNCIHFFIYRDPRDVVVSEAHYLTRMNRWHRMHRYFAKHLKTDEERISAAILGVADPGFPYDYPNVAMRFARYRGWLGRDDVFSIRFEDLTTAHRCETLLQMIAFYAECTSTDCDAPAILKNVEANISPYKSHTFREGRIGGWRVVFTRKHKEQMKAVAGQLLIDLGYERGMAW